jgi:hypothetical protein
VVVGGVVALFDALGVVLAVVVLAVVILAVVILAVVILAVAVQAVDELVQHHRVHPALVVRLGQQPRLAPVQDAGYFVDQIELGHFRTPSSRP